MRWKRSFFALVTVLFFFLIVEAGLWLAGVPTLMAERDPFQGFSDRVRVFELDRGARARRSPTFSATRCRPPGRTVGSR